MRQFDGAASQLIYCRQDDGSVVMAANRISMDQLAWSLGEEAGLPATNRTNLKGSYELSLRVPGRLERRDDGGASDPTGVDLFKSIQKLGLRLEKGTAPLQTLTVEHAENVPTEN